MRDILLQKVNELDEVQFKEMKFRNYYTGCLILTQNNQILLQQRAHNWKHYPNFLSEFGGGMEKNETPLECIIRELDEELGAKILAHELIYLGAISESATEHREIIFEYFWHDKFNHIQGCFEGQPRYFESSTVIMQQPKVTQSVEWLLQKCLAWVPN